MSKNRITFLLATALAVATVGLVPAAAHAEAASVSSTRAAADGNLYAWEHSWKNGRQAAWYGDSTNWADRNMRNQASSVDNQGYAGAYDDVRLYWDVSYGGASYCLPNANYLMDMRYDYFPHNGAGGGQALDNNISSHRWVNSC